MEKILNITEIEAAYPNEWVLIANPKLADNQIDVAEGIPIYHSKDKKEVCYIGRDKTKDFDKITLVFTGAGKRMRKIASIISIH